MKTAPELLGEIAYIAGCGAEMSEYSTPDHAVRARFVAIQELAETAITLASDSLSTIQAQAATIADLQAMIAADVEREVARRYAASSSCELCSATLGQAHSDACAYRNPEESR